ncbi:MAG: toprim domain-containing protein [Rickettsiales bacterium]|nr:MAG: toprim domain-containing protein [Rickettsiales bacterium]
MVKYNVEEIKSIANIVDVVSTYLPLKKNGANYTCTCPFHNEKSGSFTVNSQKNIYKCFGCGKSGDSITFLMEYKKIEFKEAVKILAEKYNIMGEDNEKPKQAYKRPQKKQSSKLSEKLIEWFKSRKISEKTLLDLKVSEGLEWMPQTKSEVNTIQFNYFKEGELINTKFRDGNKNFKLVSGAELVMYNLDSIKGKNEIIIVEGEIDALSLHECGLTNVISVPNGAGVGKNNLTYLDNSIEFLPENAKYILALDNDKPGINLREELARRLGYENCIIVTFKDCKDANDCLVKYGKEAVIESVKDGKEYPIIGVYSAKDIKTEIINYYLNGLPKPVGIGINRFDELLKFKEGYMTIITGIPGHGKSEFLDFIMCKLNILHGWKFGMYSPENHPLELHFSKMAEKIIGKPFEGDNKMTPTDLDVMIKWHSENFYFINPDDDFTTDSIINTAKQLVRKKGIKGLVIDAWNKLDHKYTTNETKYISEELDKLGKFCERYGVHLFLVAHPTKITKDKQTGLFDVPNLYSISGSANFYNKTANGMSVYINRDTGKSEIYIQKVKFKHWGKPGKCVFGWDKTNGRYFEDVKSNENWLQYEGSENTNTSNESVNIFDTKDLPF